MISDILGVFKELRDFLLKAHDIKQKNEEKYREALDRLSAAVIETQRYLSKIRGENGQQFVDPIKEDELSHLWRQAGVKLVGVDDKLARLSMIKGICWSDERLWDSQDYKDLPLKIEEMTLELRRLMGEEATQ